MLKARRSDRPPAAAKKLINKKSNTINNSNNSKVGLIKKYVIYILLSLIILFIGFTLLAPMLVNLKVWKPEIIAMLESETGKVAEIEGDIELSIYPSPKIKIYGISLKDKKLGITKNFFNSNSVVAKLSLWPLFKGSIVIEKIVFEDLVINLENYSKEDPNWVFNKIKKENNIELEGNDFYNAFSKYNHIKYPNIKINEYTITKGTIVYNDNYKINLKDVVITNNNNADIIKGSININEIKFSLNSSFIKNNDIEKSWKSSFSLINKDIKIIANGNINYNNYYPSIESNLEISSNNIENLSKNYKYLNLLNKNLKLNSELSLSFKNNNLFYSIYNLSINSGPFILTGAVSGNNGELPNIDMVLSSNNINLDLLRENINKFNDLPLKDEEKGLIAIHDYLTSYQGTLLLSVGTSKFLDYPIRNLVIDLKKDNKNYILNKAEATFPGNTNISFQGNIKNNFSIFEGGTVIKSDNIRDFCKWLSLDLHTISDSRLRKTMVNSNVVFREGGATFVGINGQIDASTISGEVRLRYKDLNSLFANIKIDKINLDAYVGDNPDKESIKYKNDLNIFTFNDLNIDIDIGQLLFYKNQYNNIKFVGLYKKKILQIDKLNILDFAKGDLNFNGNINYNNKNTIYDIQIDYKNKNLEEVYSFYKLPKYLKMFLVGNTNLSAIAKGELNSIFTNIKLETPSFNIVYDGDLEIENFHVSEFDGKIDMAINNLSDLFLVSGKNDAFEKANYSSDIVMKNNIFNVRSLIFESPKYQYKGDISIGFLKNNDIDLNIDLFTNFTSINHIKNIYNYFITSSTFPIKGRMKLEAESFNINDFMIYNLNSAVKFKEEEIILSKFEGNLLSGNISVEGQMSNKNEYNYKGNINISKIDGNELINNYFSYSKIQSEINSKLKINGKASSLDEFFDSLNAEGEVTMKKPVIIGLDFSKLMTAKSINDKLSLEKVVFESFNTNRNTELESIFSKYSIKNNNLILKNTILKNDQINASLNGEFNIYNKNYDSSFKVNFLDDDEKHIIIHFINDKNINKAYVEDNYIIKEITIPNDVTDKQEISINDELIDDDIIDNIINDLSKNPIVEKLDGQNLLEDKIDNIINANVIDKPIEEVNIVDSEPLINIPKLPIYLKETKNLINYEYYKPSVIINSLLKPKLPTQEDLLDSLLESVLSPDN